MRFFSPIYHLYEVLTFALRVLQDMLLKRGISWISEWFCTELWESLLQVGPLLFGTCQIPGVRTGYFLWGLFFVVLAFHCMLVMKTLTHSSEDSAVHAECNCNSSLAHSSRARVDERTLTRPQTPTHHHGVISCSIDHRYRGSLLQSPTHTGRVTLLSWFGVLEYFSPYSPSSSYSEKVPYQLDGTSQRKRLSASTQVAKPLAGRRPITRCPLGSLPENSIPSMHCWSAMSPARRQ